MKLTPTDVSGSEIEEYNKSISEWTIPDGEIAVKPEVQSVVIDGREMKFGADKQAAFLSVVGKYDAVPEALVTVDASKYTYEVTNADSTNGGITTIVVKDKNNSDIFSTYTVKFVEIPEPKSFDGMTSIQVANAEASDEPQAASHGYYRWCVLDNDINSRWTAQGGGNWILLELEEETTVDNLMIAFYNPTKKERGTYFGINVSADGENWELVWSGTSDKKAQNGTYQQYELGGKTAKYIRLDCNGNTSQGITAGWNNIAEIVVTKNDTEPSVTATPEPSATPTAAPTATPTLTPTSTPEVIKIIQDKSTVSYEFGSDGTISIYCAGEHSELISVDMDGKEVDKSNYTVKAGSTILEFKAEYLETLSVGTHEVTLHYTGNRNDSTEITLKAKAGADNSEHDSHEADNNAQDNANDDGVNIQEDTKGQTETTGNPDTGDDANVLVWSYATILAGIIALVIGIVYRKKWKGILSVLLVCVLLSGMFTNKISVAAADTDMTSTGTTKELTVTESVTVGESTLEFCVKVFYTLPNEYEVLMDAYGEALYSENFDTCIEGNAVHNDVDKEKIPDGAYYYYSNDGTNKYGGSVTFEGGNGYVLMKDAYGQMVFVKPGIEDIASMKYLVVESKLQYNTPGIEFKFMTRGANSSNKAKIETLGVLKDGTFSNADGTEIATISAGNWHTFTYVFDIASKKYDLYIDGEKKQEGAIYQYFRGFNGSDHFRLKAASLADDADGADIMIDDIKVYGSDTDLVSSLAEETYDALISAYEDALLYSEDFNDCTDGAAVHNDKENVPEGAYYYCANDGTNDDGTPKYGGTITFVRGNGHVLMKEAYGQMVYVKPGIEGIADMKYLVVESKLQYNTSGIEFRFMTRGANSSNKAKIETLGVLKDGKFSKEDGTEIATISEGNWHTFTYVFDIASNKYDLYIDGEKKQEGATCSYFRGFNGSDHFRLKAASLTEGADGADIMIDDIRVYGSATDPTVIQTTTE